MYKGPSLAVSDVSEGFENDGDGAVRIVAVGDPSDWEAAKSPLPTGQIAFLSFDEVTAERLGRLKPKVIYSPVLARNFDCVDLAVLLHEIGFDGVYTANGQGLPKPELIVREVRHMCPRLNFEISAAFS